MFGLFEGSRQKGRPIELYRFEYGTKTGAFSAQTNCEQVVTRSGVDYLPHSISRSNIVVTGSLDRAQLDVIVGKTNPIAELFRVFPPEAPVNLTILEGHVGDADADFKQIWGGRVVTCSFELSKAKLICEPIGTKTQDAGLKRHYQVACPHVLYGPKCRAALATWLRETTIVGIDGNTVHLADGWAGAVNPSKYFGGMIKYPSSIIDWNIRTIIKVVDGMHLKLSYVPQGLSVGDAVKVAPGCNHSLTGDCTTLYDNAKNYGGCPFIPYKQPVNNFSNFF